MITSVLKNSGIQKFYAMESLLYVENEIINEENHRHKEVC